MKSLIAHKRWIFGALIILAIGILVWFAGPLLSFGDRHPLDSRTARWLIIILVLMAWLGFEAFRIWRIRRKSRLLVDGLSAGGQDATLSREEAQVLRDRFTAAMASLKGTRFGNASGATALYQLPWYMFIGAPGSGKTTTLLNSGLRFPLAQPGESAAALSGIGGTRNCDWWFTDQAVLIDTAGRYTTQDSNASVDQAAWKTFLGLLKRFRPRQPINGILVTLSVQDLLSFDLQERQRYAQIVRQRVEELQLELGLEFPIYVLVTKVDLVSGFNEFFATFDAEQRAQVWGVTFGLDLKSRVAEGARTGFDKEFPALTAKLNELLFQRLQEERDAERRAVMYPFPQQLAALGPLISEFLEGAFGESKLQVKAIVRGLYFISGTQQGAPIDRLLSALAKSLNLSGGKARASASVGASKAFCITRLLREVVFPEAALAGFSERRETTLRRLSWSVLAAALVLSIGFVAATSLSYFRNSEALAAAQPVSARAQQGLEAIGDPQTDDLPQLVDALAALTLVPPAIHDPVDTPPWSMRIGLYPGRAVADRVGERYRVALQQGLLPRVALQLERAMTAPQSKPEQVYGALKSYLMLYEPKRMDPRWFVDSVSDFWAASYPRPTLDAARPHLDALAQLPDLQVARFHERNAAAVTAARERVARMSIVDRAYALLRGSPTGQGVGLRLSEVVGPAGVGVLERASGASLAEPIPAIFTRDGYRIAVRGKVQGIVTSFAREEEWVMGDRTSGIGKTPADQISTEVQRRYFSDYKATWDSVLKDVRVRKLSGLKDALSTAQVLSQADSPLRKLVVAADEQTRLSSIDTKQAVTDAAKEQGKEKVKQVVNNATGNLLGGKGGDLLAAALPSPTARAQEAELDQYFAGLRRLAGDGKTSEIDAAMQTLNEVFNDLVAMQGKAASGSGLHEVPPGLARARIQAERFAAPVGGAILALTEFGEREASGGVKKEMKAGVGGAAAVCARSIPGKYPFAKGSAQDLGVQDFVTVFKSGGELDAFFASNLASFVDKSGGAWRLKSAGEGAPPISPATLRQFQNAEAIRIAFLGGGSSPAVTADITVVSGEGEVTLDYDGTPSKMKASGNGARVAWPARPGVRLLVGGQQVAAAEGPWSLFRLIDKGAPEAGSGGDKLRVSFATPGGQRVTLEVRAGSSAFNPFRLREIESFACPRE